ncbi:2-phosphosulfolactate phosphatase [Maritalea porphyrae]|jgi:2-phosphosulfolactate phosphatase|uniref:2-phosphosulfolactate phosphatase n=1 Tax=Maritalea porphyrae TaxID=880732 RepID=UPI0022AE535F|nr:2-phosphosulfolactate phosphatase [Maritalea porphyrae]MCZ4270980.1 2-phosphosulfolactate phosphatase [Maritalea porphyrae]
MARVHVEWGERALDADAQTAVIVDCLSFSSALSVACSRGATVYPFGLRDGAKRFAQLLDLQIVGKRKGQGLSLSPPSLNQLTEGQRIVLPSPNGSNLTLFARQKHVLSGALRNAKSVTEVAQRLGENVIIVAAGERWQTDGTLRPAFEDWVAAGAIASYFSDGWDLSAEAKLAVASFQSLAGNLYDSLADCLSGKELIERGFVEDVEWAAKLDVSDVVPTLMREARTYREIGLNGNDVPSETVLDMQVCRYESR